MQPRSLDEREIPPDADLPDLLITHRLAAQIPRLADGAALHAAVAESVAELERWPCTLPWTTTPLSVDSCEQWCRTCRADFELRQDFKFLLRARSDPGRSVVGIVEIHSLDRGTRAAQLGYWVRSSAVKNGYVTEGLAAITQWAYARLGIRRLNCVANESSAPFVRRLGFAEAGSARCGDTDRIEMWAAVGPEGLTPKAISGPA